MPNISDASSGSAPEIELLVFPYAAAAGRSMLHVLMEELDSGRWTNFQVAVAFAKSSGNFPDLLGSLRRFAERGGQIALTFGADSFSGESKGSDFAAIEDLLQSLELPGTTVQLYHEKGRTFHPKVYLFHNELKSAALLIIGSSNWSEGGFAKNLEANVLLRLNLTHEAHRRVFAHIRACFNEYWTEQA